MICVFRGHIGKSRSTFLYFFVVIEVLTFIKYTDKKKTKSGCVVTEIDFLETGFAVKLNVRIVRYFFKV